MKRWLWIWIVWQSIVYSGSIIVPGSLTHEYTISPKEKVSGEIPIQNTSDRPAMVRVSLVDYQFNAQGESLFLDKGAVPRSSSSWIRSGVMQFEVAPHSTYLFPYTLEVPEDPKLEGSYWSLFLVEEIDVPTADNSKERSLGVTTIIRYGVQIISNIEGKGSYELKVLGKKLSQVDGKKTFMVSVENVGSLSQTPTLLVDLFDTRGKKVAKLEASKQRILPACSVTYQVDFSGISPGKYKAIAVFDHGKDALFGAKYDIDIPK